MPLGWLPQPGWRWNATSSRRLPVPLHSTCPYHRSVTSLTQFFVDAFGLSVTSATLLPVRFLSCIGSLLFSSFWNYSTYSGSPMWLFSSRANKAGGSSPVWASLFTYCAKILCSTTWQQRSTPTGNWPSTSSGRRQVTSSQPLQLPLVLELRGSHHFTAPFRLFSDVSGNFLATSTPARNLLSVSWKPSGRLWYLSTSDPPRQHSHGEP